MNKRGRWVVRVHRGLSAFTQQRLHGGADEEEEDKEER